MKTQEVYIGNGETIKVNTFEDKINYLDLEKVRKVVEENPDKEIYVGATADWRWTATEVNKERLEKMDKFEDFTILLSTCWDTFSLEINGKKQDATIEIEKKYADLVRYDSFRKGIKEIEFWLSGIYQILKTPNYALIKDFTEEVKPITKKYLERIDTLKKYDKAT